MSKQNQTQADADLLALVAKLTAENEALKAAKAKAPAITCKVGEKGGVSVYGLGKFPVSLYGSQWARFLEAIPTIAQFVADHAAQLTVKDAAERETMTTALQSLAARYNASATAKVA